MKLKVVSKTNTEVGKKDLPEQFYEPVRPDLIARAVRVLQFNSRQPYGSMPKAGMRHTAELSRRRRKYRGSYGHGISRVQRKILSRRGTRFNWVGAVVPGTVGGRRAHPPKADKKWDLKLNVKENRKAIRSAMAASVVRELVEERGHNPPKEYPFIVKADIEAVSKSKEAITILEKLGFAEELERTKQTSAKTGRAKLRGRTKSKKTGLLIVVSDDNTPLAKAAGNIPGVDVVPVKALNAELLAPGSSPGRISLFTEGAIDILDKEKFFSKSYKGGKK